MTPIEFSCPHCSRGIKVKPHGAGRTIDCPGCKSPVVVPSPEMAAVGDDDDFAAFNGFGGLQPLEDRPAPTPVRNPPTPEMVSYMGEAPRPSVRITAHEASLPMSRSYPALSRIAGIARILGYLVGIFGTIAILVTMLASVPLAAANGDSLPGAIMAWAIFAFPAFLGVLVAALFLIAAAELITLAIHIQANTLATAHASRRAG